MEKTRDNQSFSNKNIKFVLFPLNVKEKLLDKLVTDPFQCFDMFVTYFFS
jgi:hypothetical protein